MNKNSIRQSIFADEQAIPAIHVLTPNEYRKATSREHIDLALESGKIAKVGTHRDDKLFIDRVTYTFHDGLTVKITYEPVIK